MRIFACSILFIFFSILFLFVSCKKKEEAHLQYTVVNVGEKINLRKITFFNETTGFCCGGTKNTYGSIYKTTNAGATWEKTFSSNTYSVNSVFILNDSIGYACGDSLTFYTSRNAGNTWIRYVFPNLPWKQYMVPFHSLFFLSEEIGFIVGGEHFSKGGISLTLYGGTEWWHPCFYNEFDCIVMPDENTIYIGGYGMIYKSVDGGHTFQPCYIRGDWYRSLYFFDSKSGFAAGYNGGLYKTTDGGDSWKTIKKVNHFFTESENYTSIIFTDKQHGYIAGNQGKLLITEDGGKTWNKSMKICDESLTSVCMIGSNKLALCSETGNIYFVALH